MKPLIKQKAMMILLVFLAVSLSACDWTPPKSWTLRSDGILRRSLTADECKDINKPAGCKDELTIVQFIQYVKDTEKLGDDKAIGLVITPAGAKSISDEITDLKQDLASCKGQ